MSFALLPTRDEIKIDKTKMRRDVLNTRLHDAIFLYGDPLAMSLYAISLQPLITRLNVSSLAKQCWFADDATGSGSLEELKKWWDELIETGPGLGYYPNAKECWLITKPEKEEAARDVFDGIAINITTQGHKHLGAALGSRSYLEE